MAKVSFIICLSIAMAGLCLAEDCEDSCPGPSKVDVRAVKRQAELLKEKLERQTELLNGQMELLMTAVAGLEESCDNDTDATQYKNCAQIQKAGYTEDDVFTIYPKRRGPGVSVFCDLTTDGGGWTVFQKRVDGSVDFFRGYTPYKRGFGRSEREYWLGLNNIKNLVQQGNQELRVDLEDWAGATAFAQYSDFSVGDASQGFPLHVGAFSGTAGDAMTYHEGEPFTTKDNPNAINCANKFKGAWWYKACHLSNLNGHYFEGGDHASYADGVGWYHWKGRYYSIKKTQMKIRPTGFASN